MSAFLFVLAVAARAFFTLARDAFINMRRARLVELGQRGVHSAQAIQHLTEHSSQLHATAEVGALFSLLFAASIAAVEFVPKTSAWLASFQWDWLSPAARNTLSYGVVMLVVGMLLFIFGRLVPEALAVRYPEPIALASIWPMRLSSVLLLPVVRVAVLLSNLMSIPLGGQRRDSASLVTQEELKTLVDAGEEEGLIEEEEKEMILSVLDFGDTVAREVMVPRIDLVAVEVGTPLDEAINLIISAGHSRIPVYQETVDDIVGILYAKDMLKVLREGTNPPLAQIVRQAYFTPESKKVSDLLRELQARRVHACIVVDEYGGTAGMVTIEDIIEEIVGEIQDEYDTEEPDHQALPDGAGYMLEASMHIGDVNALMQVELPTDQSDTLAGFIYDQLGAVPEVGATVHYAGILFEVLAVSDRRILKVKATYEREEKQSDHPEEEARKLDDGNPDGGPAEHANSDREGQPN